jgi:hypothetical protein
MSVVAVLGGGVATAVAPAASAAGEGATISGTVTAAVGGATLGGICVTAWTAVGPTDDPQKLAVTTTAADGTYSLSNADLVTGASDLAGDIKVSFDGTGNCPGDLVTNYVAQWWNAKPTSAEGTTITAADTDTIPNIDAAMALGGAVSGTVTRNGTAFAGTCVVARTTDADELPTASAATNNSGKYTLHGVPAGTAEIIINEQVAGRLCPGGEVVVPGPQAFYSSIPVTANATTAEVDAALGFPIAIDRDTVHEGESAVLHAVGIAHGTVVFSAPGIGTVCSYTIPATGCNTSNALAIGTYGPITAQYTPSVGAYTGLRSSTNQLTLTVDRNPVVPGAPTNVHASAHGTTITLTWGAPVDDGGSAVTGYSITGSGGTSASTGAGTFKTSFSHLKAGTYRFTVKANNAIGTGPGTKSNAITIVVATSSRVGYWMLGSDGKVYAFGDAKQYGNASMPSVAIATRRDGKGYWVTDAAGRVSHFGTAAAHGGHPALHMGEQVTAISASPSGNGYWLFTNRGRAFAYGDAHFYGDMTGVHLAGPVIASAATATGKGYYMIGSDGGVFTFGDATFHGSTGGMHLNKPVVGISPTPDGSGYWLVASDGGVFAFHAPFRGSLGGMKLNKPVNGLVAFGNGYLMVASDGGVFDFSNQHFLGSLAANPPSAPIIGIAAFTA